MTLKAKLLTCFVSVFFLMALVGLHSFYEINHAQQSLRKSTQSAHNLQAAFADAYRFISSAEIRLNENSAISVIKQLKAAQPLSTEARSLIDELTIKLETAKGVSFLSQESRSQLLNSISKIIFLEEKAHSEAITSSFLENTKRRNEWLRTSLISFLVAAFVTLVICGSIVIEVDSLASLAKRVVTMGVTSPVKLATSRTKNSNDELGFVANVLEDVIEERRSFVEATHSHQPHRSNLASKKA